MLSAFPSKAEGPVLPSLPLALFWAALPPGHSIRWIHLPANFVCLPQHKTWGSLLLLRFLPPSVLTAHVTQCSVLRHPTVSALCKCPFLCASHHGFYLVYSLNHFLFDSISFSFSLSLPPLASFMWSIVLSLPAAIYMWQLLSYLSLSGAFRMHKGWRVRCQECGTKAAFVYSLSFIAAHLNFPFYSIFTVHLAVPVYVLFMWCTCWRLYPPSRGAPGTDSSKPCESD